MGQPVIATGSDDRSSLLGRCYGGDSAICGKVGLQRGIRCDTEAFVWMPVMCQWEATRPRGACEVGCDTRRTATGACIAQSRRQLASATLRIHMRVTRTVLAR
jgi:hypothetical protein